MRESKKQLNNPELLVLVFPSSSVSVHGNVLGSSDTLCVDIGHSPLYLDFFMILAELSISAPDLELEICWTNQDLHIKVGPVILGPKVVPVNLASA